MRIIHFCAGLEENNGMANTARQFVAEETAAGKKSELTNDPAKIGRGVDVVYIHGAWLPVLWKVAKRAKAAGAKLVVRPAGSYDPVRLAFHGWKKRLVGFFERRMLARADVLLATCSEEAEWIRAYMRGVRWNGKIEITDLKRFFDLEKSWSEKVELEGEKSGSEKLELEGEKSGSEKLERGVNVLYLGRRHPLKGVEYLERAVEDLNHHSPTPTHNSNCISLRMESSLFGEEKELAWKWCDVLCLPTLSENFGRVVAEALERGKRVVVTDGAPAWREYFAAHPERGVYVKGYREGSDEERVELLKKALQGGDV